MTGTTEAVLFSYCTHRDGCCCPFINQSRILIQSINVDIAVSADFRTLNWGLPKSGTIDIYRRSGTHQLVMNAFFPHTTLCWHWYVMVLPFTLLIIYWKYLEHRLIIGSFRGCQIPIQLTTVGCSFLSLMQICINIISLQTATLNTLIYCIACNQTEITIYHIIFTGHGNSISWTMSSKKKNDFATVSAIRHTAN